MNNDAPLTRSKHSSPPRPTTMTSEDVIRELADALRDTIVEADEAYLQGDPESAFVDLACKLIFRMKTVTVVPAQTPREAREAEIRKADAEGAMRTFEVLDRWLLPSEPGARSLETTRNAAGRTELTMTELKMIDIPNVGKRLCPVATGFFQGESVRDTYAQAATAIVCNGGDL